jgi:hydrogenase expression/formation protein HypD
VKYLDEYRDSRLATTLLERIRSRATRTWTLMEICGGQTHAIMRSGLDELLPRVDLVHGPGCPVCVTPLAMVENAIRLAATPGVMLTSYGDMLRVPGAHRDLLSVKAAGGDVRTVYSPLDVVRLARENPERQVVFFAIGFETTAPANAAAAWMAREMGLRNFSLLVSQVLCPPAIRAILARKGRVQGLIAPGHVCTVTGCEDYDALAREFSVPIVVGGFEPVDLLEAIGLLVEQLESGRAELEIQYSRSVRYEGNRAAQQRVNEVFEVCDRHWRGVGAIPQSGLRLREEFRELDAERRFGLVEAEEEPAECISAEILTGEKKPRDCAAFGIRCTPERPLGAPMVSGEGACAAYYRYRKKDQP